MSEGVAFFEKLVDLVKMSFIFKQRMLFFFPQEVHVVYFLNVIQ